MINSDSNTSKIRILKRSEPVPQSLVKPKSKVLKSKFQKKTVTASEVSKPKGVKPKVLVNKKQPNSQYKVQEVKSKTSSTYLRGPIRQWVPKSENVNTADMSKSKGKAKIMVPRQRLHNVTLTMKEEGSLKFGGNQSGKITGTGTIGNSSISINNV